jgi:hypothetical protein
MTAPLLTPTPQTSMKIAQPVEPCWNSQIVTGSHTRVGPAGTTERKKVISPRSAAPGTPATRNFTPRHAALHDRRAEDPIDNAAYRAAGHIQQAPATLSGNAPGRAASPFLRIVRL